MPINIWRRAYSYRRQENLGTLFTIVTKGNKMTQRKFALSFAWIAALLVAAPATAQLLNHPVMALPAGPAAGSTFVGAEYARGLNDNSGKFNSFGVGVGRAMERVSFMALGGYIMGDLDEVTLGASVAVHLLSDPDAVQVSLQGGFGWASFDGAPDNTSITTFQIGIAIQAPASGSGSSVRPWVMPRLDITRNSTGGVSSTDTDIGASAGLSFTSEGGAGAHISADWVNVEGGSPFGFSIGVHYALN